MTATPERVRQWTRRLRDPHLMQAQGALCKAVDYTGTYGYCCLGVGALEAGVHVTYLWSELTADPDVNDADLLDQSAAVFGENDNSDLAPYEFMEWLGFTDREIPDRNTPSAGYDLYLDVLVSIQGKSMGYAEDGVTVVTDEDDEPHPIGLADLNDKGFSFAAIADLIDYFGVVAVPPIDGVPLFSTEGGG